MFIGDGADELEADGKAGGREAAGDGDGGDSGEIGGTVGAKEQGAGGIILIGDADGFLIDQRGYDGSRGNGERIDTGIGHDEMQLLDELFAHFEGGEINRCGDFRTHIEAASHIVAVFRGTGGKPAGLLVVVGGFGPGDLISGVFCFFEERQGDFFDSDFWRAEGTKRFCEEEPNIFRDYVEEKILGNAQREFEGLCGKFARGAQTRFAFYAREDRIEEKSGVVNGASERANAIELGRKRNYAIDADAAESGF